jgi:O-antigen ligase
MMTGIMEENQTETPYEKHFELKKIMTVFSTILCALFPYRYTLNAIIYIPYDEIILSNYVLLPIFLIVITVNVYSGIGTTTNSLYTIIVGILLFVFYASSIVWSPMIGYSFQKLLYATFQIPILLLFVFFVVSRSRLYIWTFILATLLGSYLVGLELLRATIFSSGVNSIITDGLYIGVNRLLGIGIVLSVFVITYIKSTIYRLLSISCSFVNMFLMTQTGGRGPLIATCVAVISFGIWNYDKIFGVKNSLKYILVFVVSLPILLFNRGRTIDRLFLLVSDPGESVAVRIDMIIQSISLFSKQPLFGYGIGSFPTLYRMGGYMYPHNIFLEFLVESGALGLLIFIAFICICLRTIYRFRERNQVYTGMLLSLVVFSLLNASISFDIFENSIVFIYFMMSVTIYSYSGVYTK